MGTFIICILLILLILYALRSSLKHFKGEGGCCGGGSDVKEKLVKKKLNGPVIQEKVVHIQGMHCDHCRISVENAINSLDGVCAKVNLNKNLAVVQYERPCDDADIIRAVTGAGFEVENIHKNL